MYISNSDIGLILILLLIVYVIFLQFQLAKKNTLIKSIFKRINKPDSKLRKEDIVLYLENLQVTERSTAIAKDKFLDKKIQKFLFENETKTTLFLHYTGTKDVANKIIQNGFNFVNSFYKTAEYIYNDELYLVQRHHEHKQFGNYVIIICISKKTYNHYTKELNKLKTKNIAVEQLLTEKLPTLDENLEEVYILPQQFIKGYFNYTTGIIINNPTFNADYHSDIFTENLKKIHRDSNK